MREYARPEKVEKMAGDQDEPDGGITLNNDGRDINYLRDFSRSDSFVMFFIS